MLLIAMSTVVKNTGSTSMHAAENDRILFFLWLSNIPFCVYVCVYHIFFIHSSVNGQ